MVIKRQNSLEQKRPATPEKKQVCFPPNICYYESHQRLRQFLSPKEDWLMTKPRRSIFPWNKSDFKMSRPRKAPRLTCPRGQLTAHYDAKGKVHLLTSAMNVNITVHRSSFYRDRTWATRTTKNQKELHRRHQCKVGNSCRRSWYYVLTLTCTQAPG